MAKQAIPDDVVIVGSREIEKYYGSYVKASKDNGSITLVARGRNIEKAIGVSRWAKDKFGVAVEKVGLDHVRFDGGRLVSEIAIVIEGIKELAEENVIFAMFLPLALSLYLILGTDTTIMFDTYLCAGIIDILNIFKT